MANQESKPPNACTAVVKYSSATTIVQTQRHIERKLTSIHSGPHSTTPQPDSPDIDSIPVMSEAKAAPRMLTHNPKIFPNPPRRFTPEELEKRPLQSLDGWINRRNSKILPGQNKIYIVEPPKCTEDVKKVLIDTGQELVNDEDMVWESHKPDIQEIADYVRAHFYGVPVEVINLGLEFGGIEKIDDYQIELELRRNRFGFYEEVGTVIAYRPSNLDPEDKIEEWE
jgi:hypothetical protein